MEKKNLSRRAFIRAAVGAGTTRISSVLARTKPDCNDSAAATIAAWQGAEVVWRAADGSKLVVVLETDSDADTMRRLQDMTAIDGIVTADLTYTYNEEQSHG